MDDPQPANIYGEKTTKFTHSIRWDYAIIGVAALYVAWQIFGGLSSPSTDQTDGFDVVDEATDNFDARDAAEVVVQ